MESKIKHLAETCGYTYGDVTGSSRKEELTILRRMIWKRLAGEGFSYSKIGAEFGRKHNVIIYGIKKLEEQLAESNSVAIRLQQIFRTVKLPDREYNSNSLLSRYADKLGVDICDLKGGSRKADITLKRYIIYEALYRNNLTYSEIGELFNRKASSVFYGLLKLQDLASISDKGLIREIKKVK